MALLFRPPDVLLLWHPYVLYIVEGARPSHILPFSFHLFSVVYFHMLYIFFFFFCSDAQPNMILLGALRAQGAQVRRVDDGSGAARGRQAEPYATTGLPAGDGHSRSPSVRCERV